MISIEPHGGGVLRRKGLLLVLLLFSAAGLAADEERLIATDLSQVDDDFHFQGEYLGSVSRAAFGTDNLGLQVVALGDQEFEGLLLRGGLPGAGWDRKRKTTLRGRREGEQLLLSGGDYQVLVTPREALVQMAPSQAAARLRKIRRISETDGAPPPRNARVLFDGSSTSQFEKGKITPDGFLDTGALTRLRVGDFYMHLEFRTPYKPHARGQDRGNSGVYIQQRYEVQVLDSFGLEGVENDCGSLYNQKRPDVNMCFPPLSWQTYDIYFRAPRWNACGEKVANARITVLHNGVPVQSNYEIVAKTGGGKPEGPNLLPILFQNHRNPVRYRNIWIVTTNSNGFPLAAAGNAWQGLAAAQTLTSRGGMTQLPGRYFP